ncbi:hypothetical protein JL722_11100 [Aureococcus anophagefferens]|nr:hypothetical protein JL722_11100 [Aureococcus anophagefferens]
MSDALSRLTQVLNELQDTGGLTANLKISRSGDLEIVVTNSDTSPVTPSAPAAPSPPPPPAPQAEVPPGHDSWEEPEFIVQRRNAEHCRLLKSVSLSRDVCHGHGLVAVKDLEPGDRFFDVTALYAGPTHALTYFFNEDRRGDDCDAKVRLQHTYVPRLGGWVLEWRVLERLRAGDELLVDYPETDDGVKHATWPAKPPVAEKRSAPPAPKAPRAVTSRGRKVFAPASIEDSSSDDDDGGGGETAAAAPLATRRGRSSRSSPPAPPEPPRKKSRSGARRPAPPRVYKSRAEPPPPNPSNPWGLKRPPSVPRVPLNASFPRTLKLICEDPKNAAIVTWCPKAREISVVDKPTFITDVLPRYFRSNVASGRGKPGAVDDDTATAHFDGVHSRQFDSFVRQLNYYGFRKARRCTNRYVCMDYSIKSPAEFDRLSRYVPAHTASRARARAHPRPPQPPPPASSRRSRACGGRRRRRPGRPPGPATGPGRTRPSRRGRGRARPHGRHASPASPPDGRLGVERRLRLRLRRVRAADGADSDFEAPRAPPPRPPVPRPAPPPSPPSRIAGNSRDAAYVGGPEPPP